jgi:hypothetical protein
MKQILTILVVILSMVAKAQTVEEIDQLRADILDNLDQYECLEFVKKTNSNEDAVKYDTARFYHDKKGDLVYVNWRERSHTFHISGDGIDIIEFFFIDGQAVFKRSYGYYFLNPQWHREPDINETKVFTAESIREYYKLDGSALVEYKSRKIETRYKDRFKDLGVIPLEQKLERRWSDRCGDCIEQDYMVIYRDLLRREKGE